MKNAKSVLKLQETFDRSNHCATGGFRAGGFGTAEAIDVLLEGLSSLDTEIRFYFCLFSGLSRSQRGHSDSRRYCKKRSRIPASMFDRTYRD